MKCSNMGLRRQILFCLGILFALTVWETSTAYCHDEQIRPRNEWGASLLGGLGEQDGMDIEYYAVYPRWGWFFGNRWEFELEGHLGHYRLDSLDMTSIGMNGLAVIELWRSSNLSAIFTAGGGLMYLDLGKRPQIEDSLFVGLAQGGLGLRATLGKTKSVRLEYRFQHVSDPFEHADGGINYHCLLVCITSLIF